METTGSISSNAGRIVPIEEENRYIWGWDDSMEVASSIWGSIHASLLSGDLVFAYRPLGKEDGRLVQLVIVHNFHMEHGPSIEPIKVYDDDYAVGFITTGYTALLPHVPLRYLKEEMTGYLADWKINKEILNTYKAIIEDLENNGK
jgi:hypothetical protein